MYSFIFVLLSNRFEKLFALTMFKVYLESAIHHEDSSLRTSGIIPDTEPFLFLEMYGDSSW